MIKVYSWSQLFKTRYFFILISEATGPSRRANRRRTPMHKFVIERQYLVPMFQHIVVEAEVRIHLPPQRVICKPRSRIRVPNISLRPVSDRVGTRARVECPRAIWGWYLLCSG